MASGVKVNDQCMDRFQEVKMMSKKTCKRKFTVLKMGCDNSEIVPDEDCDCKDVQDFHCLLKELPTDDGRYVIFDYPFKSKSGADTSKLILVLWCPGCATIKQRMLYASSKDAVKKMINEEVPEFMCDSVDDITEEEILAKVRR